MTKSRNIVGYIKIHASNRVQIQISCSELFAHVPDPEEQQK